MQAIRVAQHVIKLVGSAGKYDISRLHVCKVTEKGGKRFEKVKSGSGRGSNRSRRDVVNEANSVGSETFSARESPNFTFKLGQTCRNLNSDNGEVTLNVGEVDLPNALLTLELRVI